MSKTKLRGSCGCGQLGCRYLERGWRDLVQVVADVNPSVPPGEATPQPPNEPSPKHQPE